MKQLIIIIFFSSITLLFAQAPQKMSYQSVIRDGNDNLLINTTVGIKISILENSPSGLAVFEETHTATTNANGLVTFQIGNGTSIGGNISSIDWGSGPFFIKIETDPQGGTNYLIEGTSELLSVPYALYAEESNGNLQDGNSIGNTTFWNGSDWVSDNNFLFNNGVRIGIDNSDPQATLHVGGTDGMIVTGELNSGQDLSVSGAGTRMFFYPKKAAFRAGNVTGSRWDDDNIGLYSFAVGDNTLASGEYSRAYGRINRAEGEYSTVFGNANVAEGDNSTVFGAGNFVSGDESTAFGFGNIVNGELSTAWGEGNTVEGDHSTAWGEDNIIFGNFATAWGKGLRADSEYETVIGRFNSTPIGSPDSWDETDALFTIANGNSTTDRNNALTVLKNGNVGIGITRPEHRLAVEVSTNTTPDGDGIGIVNTNGNFWNVHMSNTFLRFSYNNDNVSYLNNLDGAYIQASDKRLKENIQPLKDGILDKVNKINTVQYKYIRNKENSTSIGLIAQELKELFPSFVHQDEENSFMGVNYAGLSVVAIKAIQEQQKEIERLENLVTTMQVENEEIKKLLKTLIDQSNIELD